MRRAVLILSIAVGAGALLGGCSGAGAPVQELRGGATQALAQDTLTAMALVSDWVKIMYATRAPGTLRNEDVTIDGVPFVITYTSYDSGAQGVHRTNLEDNSWTWEITYPNRQVLSGSAGPLVENGDRTTQSGEWLYPGRRRRTWHKRIDFSALIKSTQTGEASTADGRTMTYVWEQAPLHFDRVRLNLADDTTVSMSSALMYRGTGGPRYRDGIAGTLKGAGVDEVSFHMFGQQRFDTWTVTDGKGRNGTFTIDENMAGSGSFEIGHETVGQLRWDHEMQGTLDLFEGRQVTVWPTAAAQSFQMRNWISGVAELGPFPF